MNAERREHRDTVEARGGSGPFIKRAAVPGGSGSAIVCGHRLIYYVTGIGNVIT